MNSQAWDPRALIELSGMYWKSCALHAGVTMGVFTVIGKGQYTGDTIARKLGADRRATSMLLNALSAMKLLVKAGMFYSNTPASTSYLSKDSPRYIGYMIMHHQGLVASWAHLDAAVKNGGPIRKKVGRNKGKELENFLLGMFNMAMNIAPRLAAGIDLSGKTHLLDLGGGSGTYAIHFCLHNPDLKATVCDLSTTKPFAKKTIKKFGLTKRVDFKAVNYLQDDIPGTYDVAWLSHILHQEGPGQAQKVVRKAVSVLRPGGTIIIHDFILRNTMDGPLFPALFSLNMLLGTRNGQSYSEEQIKSMLKAAGAKSIRRIRFDSPNDSGIILGGV